MVEILQTFEKRGEWKVLLLCSGSVVFRKGHYLVDENWIESLEVWVGPSLPGDNIPACFSVICMGSRAPLSKDLKNLLGSEHRLRGKLPSFHQCILSSRKPARNLADEARVVKYFPPDTAVPGGAPFWNICSLIRPKRGQMAHYRV